MPAAGSSARRRRSQVEPTGYTEGMGSHAREGHGGPHATHTPPLVDRVRSVDRRRLLYGDWTPVVRDGIDVLRIAFVVGTVAFWLLGRSTCGSRPTARRRSLRSSGSRACP
jgi:hypothetical protein